VVSSHFPLLAFQRVFKDIIFNNPLHRRHLRSSLCSYVGLIYIFSPVGGMNDLPIDSHLALPSAIQLWSSSQATDTQTPSRSVSWLLLDCYQSSFWIECFIIPFISSIYPALTLKQEIFHESNGLIQIFFGPPGTSVCEVAGDKSPHFLAIRRRKFIHFIVILDFPLSTFEWEKIPA